MRRLAIALVCGAVALAGLGCFAFEEIDQGQEIMDQHFGHERKARAEEEAREEAARPAERDGTGLLARARRWWNDEGAVDRPAPESSGPPPHPDNVVGRCELDGSTQFMRKFDCQLRGGRYVPLEGSASR